MNYTLSSFIKNSFLAAMLLVSGCSESRKTATEQTKQVKQTEQIAVQQAKPLLNPAFTDVDVPSSRYNFQAEKGDTLFHDSGSIIVFPAGSLVDKNGKEVKGEVQVSYREFADPVDFFIAGIPMDYDSAGTNYVFESAGMCEIYAWQDQDPLYISKKSQPQIYLTSTNSDPAMNLYYLDPVKKTWVNKGKDIINKLSNKKSKQPKAVAAAEDLPPAPAKPLKPSPDRHSFTIEIYPGSLPELEVYNNLKFEIHPDEKRYKPEDASEYWTDVKIDKGPKPGTYKVTFSNSSRRISYLTRPVFEGEDYEKALELFEQKNKEYQQLLATRQRETVEARNKQIEKDNRATKDAQLSQSIIRVFSVEGFGLWNCDRLEVRAGLPIIASFKDKSGKQLSLNKITLVNKDLNGIIEYTNSLIRAIPHSQTMIWSVVDDQFMYVSYDEYKKCKIDTTVTEYTFTMKIHPHKITNRRDVDKIIQW
jgi:hypothetical protein